MKKILIVEDTLDVREIISEVFLMEGFQVFEANNELEGLNMAIEKTPDIIVSDIMMQGMDGYQLLIELRKEPVTKNIPVIFLSSKTNKKDISYGLDTGAHAYLIKPLRVDDLIVSVKKAISQNL